MIANQTTLYQRQNDAEVNLQVTERKANDVTLIPCIYPI